VKKLLVWYALFTKRLFRRPVFPILLLCIPLLIGTLALAAQNEGGIRVAVVQEKEFDAVKRLLDSESLIKYELYPSEESAREAVASAKADAAWIFRAGAEAEIQKLATGKHTSGAVTVVEREDTVFLHMAREQLAAALYPDVSFALFSDHLEKQWGADKSTVRGYYALTAYKPIIAFESLDGQKAETSLLLMPVRGMLTLLLALTALASALYWYADAERGAFSRISGVQGRLLPIISHFCTLLPAAVVSVAALAFTGGFRGWLTESAQMLALCMALSAFSELMRKICRSPELLGALTPAVLVALLALSPVFTEPQAPKWVLYLVPSFLYLRNAALLVPYALVLAAVASVIKE
jgi:hypothetical protein